MSTVALWWTAVVTALHAISGGLPTQDTPLSFFLCGVSWCDVAWCGVMWCGVAGRMYPLLRRASPSTVPRSAYSNSKKQKQKKNWIGDPSAVKSVSWEGLRRTTAFRFAASFCVSRRQFSSLARKRIDLSQLFRHFIQSKSASKGKGKLLIL